MSHYHKNHFMIDIQVTALFTIEYSKNLCCVLHIVVSRSRRAKLSFLAIFRPFYRTEQLIIRFDENKWKSFEHQDPSPLVTSTHCSGAFQKDFLKEVRYNHVCRM